MFYLGLVTTALAIIDGMQGLIDALDVIYTIARNWLTVLRDCLQALGNLLGISIDERLSDAIIGFTAALSMYLRSLAQIFFLHKNQHQDSAVSYKYVFTHMKRFQVFVFLPVLIILMYFYASSLDLFAGFAIGFSFSLLLNRLVTEYALARENSALDKLAETDPCLYRKGSIFREFVEDGATVPYDLASKDFILFSPIRILATVLVIVFIGFGLSVFPQLYVAFVEVTGFLSDYVESLGRQ